MHLRPGGTIVVESVTQQKSGELLAGLPQAANRGQACANQIAHCLMGKVGNPCGRQFAGPMQLRQIDGVPTVRLDPISRLARDQRRRDHHTVVPRRGQLPLNAVAARSGLVAEPQHRSRLGEIAQKATKCCQ